MTTTALKITYTLDGWGMLDPLASAEVITVEVPDVRGPCGVLQGNYDYQWASRIVAGRLGVPVARVDVHDIDNTG